MIGLKTRVTLKNHVKHWDTMKARQIKFWCSLRKDVKIVFSSFIINLCKFCWIYQYFVPPVGGGGGCGSRNVANRPGRVDGVDLGVQLLELGGEEGGASPRMPQFIHRGTDLTIISLEEKLIYLQAGVYIYVCFIKSF